MQKKGAKTTRKTRKKLSKKKKSSKPVVAIVGLGRFGKVIYRMLKDDFPLILFNRSKERYDEIEIGKETEIAASEKEIYNADVVIYCISIASFEEVISKHKRFFCDNLLIDTCSVKEHPKRVFEKYLKGTRARAILTHPMFGPDSSKDGFEGLPLVMDRFVATKNEYAFWKNYFKSKGIRIEEFSAKDHDRIAANSMGVTHFIGRLLNEFGFDETPIDTVGTQYLHRIKEFTINDTWELFLNLQNYNSYTKQMRIRLGNAYDSIYNKLLPERIDPNFVVYGIQGGVGSFNHQVITKYTADRGIKDYKLKYLYTTESVLRNLHVGSIDFGLFAIFNKAGGIVKESVDAISDYTFDIVEEIPTPIRHFLMKRRETDWASIDTIMAHPQVLKQCEETLRKKYPDLKQKSGKHDLIDTAAAARALSKGLISTNVAILGPEGLSDLFDLEVVDKDLQDDSENITTFMLVKRKD
ncbi:prephenate dehydrogenase/arogenate dehydrogenase family protein [Candidatus Dojkabacteria bacterium]|nr:prephenate dehydrogenase/arogenate dehydrogenase family protein [Candidatus Dojkabacteria bacterium]